MYRLPCKAASCAVGALLLLSLVGVRGPDAMALQTDTTLIEAVRGGDLNALRELVELGIDVDASSVDGTRALHWAVREDEEGTVALLLEAGAAPDPMNRYGVTPLQLAAVNGNAALMLQLIEAGADPNTVLPEGETVLMSAARTGSADAVNLLLDNGADIEAREHWFGESALIWAAAEDHGEAVSILIDRGAEINGRSALQSFEQRRSGQSILSLGSWTPLMYAARENALSSGRVLTDAGAGLDLVDPDGATALVVAIINAHYEFAELLLNAGADPNVVDNVAGMGPLYAAVDMHRLAVGHGRPNPNPVGLLDSVDVIRLLLASGADPNARLQGPIMQRHHTAGDGSLGEGATPFMRAAKSGDVEIMEVLLSRGADPMLRMPNGSTALMYAAGLGWRNGSPAAPSFDQGTDEEAIEAMRLLIDEGLDVNTTNDAGDTPLHVAVSGRGSDSIVRFLVDEGADLTATNGREQTPMDVAESRGRDSIAELIAGARVSAQ